jgi:hypothetical protein
MLKSAQNFAAGKLSAMEKLIVGFFGIPAEDQYNLEVMIESPGYNCTLAPWNAVCLPAREVRKSLMDSAGKKGPTRIG